MQKLKKKNKTKQKNEGSRCGRNFLHHICTDWRQNINREKPLHAQTNLYFTDPTKLEPDQTNWLFFCSCLILLWPWNEKWYKQAEPNYNYCHAKFDIYHIYSAKKITTVSVFPHLAGWLANCSNALEVFANTNDIYTFHANGADDVYHDRRNWRIGQWWW